MEIKVKETLLVRPSQDTSKYVLRTSLADQLAPRVHMPALYFYKTDSSSDFFNARLLQKALSDCLVYFYPMAGRLRQADDMAEKFDIYCNGEGVTYITAESEGLLDDLCGDTAPSSKLQELFPYVNYTDDPSSYPLLLLQVTYFKCGGVSLGVLWHHTVADGTSAFHFINAWSELTRGVHISNPPYFDRSLLSGRDPPSPTFEHSEYQSQASINTLLHTDESKPKPTTTSFFNITLDHINRLKLKAKTKNGEDLIKYSTYEVVTAHVWHCVCKARGLRDDQTTELYIPINGRSRLHHPQLPSGYFGNVVFSTSPIIDLAGNIQSQPFNATVKKVNGAISRMDNEYLRSVLDYFDMQSDLSGLTRSGDTFKNPNLLITSWVGTYMEDANFGWGKPLDIRPGYSPFDGTACILPNPTRTKNLKLSISLETDHMEIFKKLFYDF